MRRGFSTIELMIALAIMVVALSAAAEASFGSQEMLAGAGSEAEAARIAGELIERERALARADFRLVRGIPAITDGVYEASLEAQPWEGEPLSVMRVTARVAWRGVGGRSRETAVAALLADYESVPGGETCAPASSGDWLHPSLASFDLASLAGGSAGPYEGGGADAYHGRLYVAISHTPSKNDPTFLVLDIADPQRPALLSATDNDPQSAVGLAAVASDGRFAYAANGSRPKTAGQLQIFDAADPAHPALIAGLSLPGNASPGTALAYRGGFAYLGTASGEGGEFAVADVRDPAHPRALGSLEVGHDVNAILARAGAAYIAHPESAADAHREQLTVADVSDPAHPVRLGGFFAPGGIGGNGKSLDLVGDTLYLGRTASNIGGAADELPEVLALDASDPASPGERSSFALPARESAAGIRAQGEFLFVLGNARLFISDLGSGESPAAIEVPGAKSAASLDCEGGTLYALWNDASGSGHLSVITPGP